MKQSFKRGAEKINSSGGVALAEVIIWKLCIERRKLQGWIHSGIKRHIVEILTAFFVVISTAIVAEEDETLSIGFENTEKLVPGFANKAKGEFSITDELSRSGKYAGKLSYEFPPKGSYVLDQPHAPYICLYEKTDIGPLKEISFWMKGDKSNNLVFTRIVDAKGERFQYKLGLSGTDNWIRYAIDFSKPIPACAHWGGDNNGKIDYPVKTVGVEIRSYAQYGECRPNGIVYFDDISITAEKIEPGKSGSSSSADSAGTSVRPASIKGLKIFTSLPNDKISIDGDLGEWNKSEPAILSKDTCKVIEGTVKNDQDASAKIYSAFDDNYLFFAAEVADDSVLGPYSGHGIWQNDGIELWLDCRFDTLSSVPLEDDYQIALSFTTKEGRPGIEVYRNEKTAYINGASKVASKKSGDGYVIEAAIPLDALLGITDKKNLPIIGFDVSLCDNDGKSFSHMFWSGSRDGALTEYGILSLGKLPPDQVDAAYQRKKEMEKAFASSVTATTTQDNKPRPGPPAFGKVSKNAPAVKQFDKFELTIDLGAEYKNPFDPDDISLQAVFTPPSGKLTVIDGFYYQFYSTRISNKAERIEKQGSPTWKVRFTPTEPGVYKYSLTLRDSQGRTAKTEPDSFESTPSDLPGFLRVSKKDRLYLEYDSGKPFFGLGYALHLWNTPNTLMFNKMHINQIAAFGGNYTSINLQTIGGGV